MSWSTAVSDAALALVALGGAGVLLRVGGRARTLGGMGFGLVGIAAALGTARYGFAPAVEPSHEAFSRVAGLVGVPLIGVGFLVSALRKEEWRRNVGFGCLIALPALAAGLGWLPTYRLAIGALGMVAVVAVSGLSFGKDRNASVAGILGALMTILAGLVIGTDGELLGFQRIDWFHYALATANAFLAVSLLRLGAR